MAICGLSIRKKSLSYLIVLGILIIMCLISSITLAVGIGGYMSEKLIARTGVADSNLVIDRSGISNSDLDIAMGLPVVALPATNVFMDTDGTHATLNGRITDLKGYPSATVWFEWGYDTGYGYSTSTQTANDLGTYSAIITHYDAGKTVYYRFASLTDGTNYSDPLILSAGNPVQIAFNLSSAVYPLIILIASFILILGLVANIVDAKTALIALIVIVFIIVLATNGLQFVKSMLNNML
jgi:hypothetical protein